MLVAGYLDWRSQHAPKRAADRADERLARQGEGTLAAIEEDREQTLEARRARSAALRDELARRGRQSRRHDDEGAGRDAG
ncbi:MAG: hypothetical protein ACRDNM_00805 [Gaiellaceae bacterium]